MIISSGLLFVDALTDILRSVSLCGGVYFRCDLSAPWGMQIDQKPVAEFHVVVRGTCWLEVLGESGETKAFQLQAGDLIVFPHGQAHAMMDTPGSPLLPAGDMFDKEKIEHYGPLTYGTGSAHVCLLCGYFQFDQSMRHPLLEALPPFIHIHGTDELELSWLQTTINFIGFETKTMRPGTEAVIDRLVEVLFIQIMRAYLAQSASPQGILGAIADPRIGLALNAMHQQPGQDWSLDSLASTAGMSRSAFAQRFLALSGQTPMKYLTLWRMQQARRLLESSQLSMVVIAEKAGYQSEVSFSKAFKKCLGISPGACRRKAIRTVAAH
jgi:AraC-like DNA-binding protein